MKQKRPETTIIVTTTPPSMRLDDFAIETRRHRSQIDKAVAEGRLNWGKANGVVSVVIDEIAEAYIEKCRANDKHKKKLG